MHEKLSTIKQHITKLAQQPKFKHHEWYVRYHLDIVEKLSLELCALHPDANQNMVLALVWLHDYGKILGAEKSYETTITEGEKLLTKLGFSSYFMKIVLANLAIIDKKDPELLKSSSIEAQIVSSADGASHFVGPFFSIYWHENPDKDIEELMESNKKKIQKDWERKIVLEGVKKQFEWRYKLALEQAGEFPLSFLV